MSGPGASMGTRDGIAALELVLVLPILLALLALAVDGGRLLADYHAVSKSVRDAARVLARAEAVPGPCVPGAFDRARPEVARAIRLAMTGAIDGDPAAGSLVAGWSAADLGEAETGIRVSLECLGNAGAGLAGLYEGRGAVPSVVVEARVPFSFGFGRTLGLGPRMTFRVAHKTAQTGV